MVGGKGMTGAHDVTILDGVSDRFSRVSTLTSLMSLTLTSPLTTYVEPRFNCIRKHQTVTAVQPKNVACVTLCDTPHILECLSMFGKCMGCFVCV